jgi:hypothetical protein
MRKHFHFVFHVITIASVSSCFDAAKDYAHDAARDLMTDLVVKRAVEAGKDRLFEMVEAGGVFLFLSHQEVQAHQTEVHRPVTHDPPFWIVQIENPHGGH